MWGTFGTQPPKLSQFAAYVRLNDWAPDAHNAAPFQWTHILPFPAVQTTERRTEEASLPWYAEGRVF